MQKKSYWIVTLFGLLLAGCGQNVRQFEVKGVIQSISEDRHSASIRHEEIPGYMVAMTMNFNIQDPQELENISADDEITFRLVVTENEHWIEQIQRVGDGEFDADDTTVNDPNVKELAVGDLLPDYTLLDENGEEVRFSDFRGEVLAFTFIFTRCPIPDYCPQMSNHFADARTLLTEQENAPENWQFLSISFDPDYDTPEILKSYADRYRSGNDDRWLFASAPEAVLSTLAPQLDLMLARDALGSISHNLRTVVLDPEGRIAKQFDGNFWTPEQLVEAIAGAAE